jgi:antitoxin VapB
MFAAAHQIQPGMTEQHIAAILGSEVQQRGAQPIVNLIATDERAYHFRHPLPTDKKLERYVMLVLCGRKWGLVTSITRLVHFGPVPLDLQQRIAAAAAVFAAFVAHTRPRNTLGAVLAQAKAAYASQGFGDEWQRHHQGGAAGYESREYLGLPGSRDVVSTGQAYAWNPSIAGAKVEDTILVGSDGNQNLTATPGWPEIQLPLKAGIADSQDVSPPLFSVAGPLVL